MRTPVDLKKPTAPALYTGRAPSAPLRPPRSSSAPSRGRSRPAPSAHAAHEAARRKSRRRQRDRCRRRRAQGCASRSRNRRTSFDRSSIAAESELGCSRRPPGVRPPHASARPSPRPSSGRRRRSTASIGISALIRSSHPALASRRSGRLSVPGIAASENRAALPV